MIQSYMWLVGWSSHLVTHSPVHQARRQLPPPDLKATLAMVWQGKLLQDNYLRRIFGVMQNQSVNKPIRVEIWACMLVFLGVCITAVHMQEWCIHKNICYMKLTWHSLKKIYTQNTFHLSSSEESNCNNKMTRQTFISNMHYYLYY